MCSFWLPGSGRSQFPLMRVRGKVFGIDQQASLPLPVLPVSSDAFPCNTSQSRWSACLVSDRFSQCHDFLAQLRASDTLEGTSYTMAPAP